MSLVLRILPLVLLVPAFACSGKRTEHTPPDPAPVDQTGIAEPDVEGPAVGASRLRSVYVPAYSHVLAGRDSKDQTLLSILLSVRNIDSSEEITLTHVDYYDTSGHRVRRYLDAPRTLRPLETAEFVVERRDDVGGSGANFLVFWEGPTDAHPLLTESVMVGQRGAGFVGFTSRGIELDRRPDTPEFGPAAAE